MTEHEMQERVESYRKGAQVVYADNKKLREQVEEVTGDLLRVQDILERIVAALVDDNG